MKNFTRLCTLASALLVGQQALATIETIDLRFTTLPEITITEEQAINFGQVVTLTSGHTCTMDMAPANNTLLAGDELEPGGGLSAPTGTPGAFTGNCAPATAGTPGIYRINSFPGARILVNVAAGNSAGNEISFSPLGYVINYGAAGADDSARTPLSVGTDADVFAPATSDDNIVVIPGTNVMALGGTVTNATALSAEQTFAVDFEVTVTYQ